MGDRLGAKLDFDPDSHQYRLNGQPVPSVTQLLRALNLAPEIKTATAKNAALRGQVIHRGTQAVEAGIWEPDTTTPELVPYLASWASFLKATRARVEESERLVCSPEWMVAGTLDKLVWIADQLWLIEIKTGRAEPWHRLQAACYWLLAEQIQIPVERAAIVYLDPSGYSMREIVQADREASLCLMKLCPYLMAIKAIRF